MSVSGCRCAIELLLSVGARMWKSGDRVRPCLSQLLGVGGGGWGVDGGSGEVTAEGE